MTGPGTPPAPGSRAPARWARALAALLAVLALAAAALVVVLEPDVVRTHLSHDKTLGEATTGWLQLYRRLAAGASLLLAAAALGAWLRAAQLEEHLRRWLPRLLLAASSLLAALLAGELLVRALGQRAVAVTRAYEEHLQAFWRSVRPQLGEGGLRGKPLERERPPGVLRVLVLGDSFVFGFGVPRQQDTFTAALERELEAVLGHGRVQVLNGGLPGACTVEETAAARWLLPRVDADLVLLGYYPNDIESRAAKERLFARRRLLPLISDNLVRHSRLWRLLDERLVDWLRGEQQGYTEHVVALHEREQARHRGELAALAEVVRATGVPLAAVLFPVLRDLDDYPLAAVHEHLLATFRELAVPTLDLAPTFAGEDAEGLVVAPYDRHLDARGLSLAAAATAEFVLAAGLLPGPP